jgi:hypothetical protein
VIQRFAPDEISASTVGTARRSAWEVGTFDFRGGINDIDPLIEFIRSIVADQALKIAKQSI